MGEGDVQAIKDGLVKVEQAVDKLSDAVADLRVLVAGNYVPKDDYLDHLKVEEVRVVALHQKIGDHEKSERAERWKIFGAAMTMAAFVFGVIQWVVSLFRVKG